MGSGRARAAAASALAGILCALGQGAAQAHTDLVSSYPASGASVSTLPDQVVLEFDEPMAVASEGLVVRNPEGGSYPVDVLTSGDSDVLVAVLAPGGSAGRWEVAFEAVSRDGHVVADSVEFWVGAASGALSADEPPPFARSVALLLVLLAAGFSTLLRAMRWEES